MTPAGIEPATFRFVAQHLNHCASLPSVAWVRKKKSNSEKCKNRFMGLLSIHKQDRQCTYNLHPGAFAQPLLQWKINNYRILWVCICNLSYPACNADASYCHLRAVRLYHIFPLYLINGTMLERK